jgi:hypothetical protein
MATSLRQKLQLKAGQRLVVLNVPEAHQDRLFAELPELEFSTRTPKSPAPIALHQ